MSFNEIQKVMLKPEGHKIFVSQANKQEYISLYIDWYFNKSIETAFEPFKKGFYKVVSKGIIRVILFYSNSSFFRPKKLKKSFVVVKTSTSMTFKKTPNMKDMLKHLLQSCISGKSSKNWI
jgi:hypothetical protein